MYILKGRVRESSSFISGSTQPLISTLTPSPGIPNTLCNHSMLANSSRNFIFLFHFLGFLIKLGFGCSFSVDDTPIREFKNLESIGVGYPKSQAMSLQTSIWDAEDWATRGGLVKTDWSQAPFTASYRNFNANACIWSSGRSSCSSGPPSLMILPNNSWWAPELDGSDQAKLRWVQSNYMIYNYCTDARRFPGGFPLECHATWTSYAKHYSDPFPDHLHTYLELDSLKFCCHE